MNPRYSEVGDLRCYPSLAELPEKPDLVFLAVPAAAGSELLAQAGASGIRAAVVNASGYADAGNEGRALEALLQLTARNFGIAVCGPNNMGLINVHERIALWTSMHPPSIHQGALALISQSGSVAIALTQDERRLGLSHVISTGNEAVLTTADYLDYLSSDDRVRVIALFIETIRDPALFGAAASRAIEQGKRIVALKVGSTERARAAVSAHTGALSGDDQVYDAFFRRCGVLRVRDLDELLELCTLLLAYPSPPATGRLVIVTLSGGEAALLADTAAQAGVALSDLPDTVLETLRPLFPLYAPPKNPIDAWGLGWSPERFERILDVLSSDRAIGAIAFGLDATAAGGADTGIACEMARLCVGRAGAINPKLVFFNNMTGGLNEQVAATLMQRAIPYLSGMRQALAALGKWMRSRELLREGVGWNRDATARTGSIRVDVELPESDPERFQLLSGAGIPMAPCRLVDSPDAAVEMAQTLGYPVALKAGGRNMMHKSDLGLVRLGLNDSGMVREAFADVTAKLNALDVEAPEIVIQPMVAPGVELIIGVRNDPAFGTLVAAGLGGVYVEVFRDTSLRIAPIDQEEALLMLEETHAGGLLSGARGRGPFDLAEAARAIVALAEFGLAMRNRIVTVEVNPLIVLKAGRGVVGVDLLIEPLETTEQGASHAV